jgi:hypothetical protein
MTQRRIELTPDIMDRFFGEIFPGEVSKFSEHKGLRYGLIYNLVHGRINSLSVAEYRRIFGEDPPEQEESRVDGDYFRGMVRLWLFLNDHTTEKDLYNEFYGSKPVKKPDYRIFTGATKTVEERLERMMERKFLEQGLSREETKEWIGEFDRYPENKRVSYEMVKPILARLQKNLKVHPTRLLNRWIASYESGELKTIGGKLYEDLLALDRKAQEAVRKPSRAKLEKLREEVYGVREGLILFSAIEEELEFLKKYGGRSVKKYLGRSMGKYKRSKLKRVAIWRAEKILEDCKKVMAENPKIPVMALPKRYRIAQWRRVTGALEQVVIATMFSSDKLSFEKEVLTPTYHSREDYERDGHGYVSLGEAAEILGMSQKAFGLLMATHSEVFKRIGRYEGKWSMPDLYLFEVSARVEFALIRAKYEWLARKRDRTDASARSSTEKSPYLYVLKSTGKEGGEAHHPHRKSSDALMETPSSMH